MAHLREISLSQFPRANGADPAQARTPTVLVNGRPFIATLSFKGVAKAIEAELASAK